jgi:hypothetical protein
MPGDENSIRNENTKPCGPSIPGIVEERTAAKPGSNLDDAEN